MRSLPLYAAVATVIGLCPAHAAVLTVGNGYAQSCFEAADGKTTSFQSVDVCNRALNEEALFPEDRVATHVNRGILHLRRGSMADASADFDRALALNPNEADAWLNKAILNVRSGRSGEAMPYISKALELRTRRPAVAYFVRAMVNEDAGRVGDAYRDLQRAHQLEPRWYEPARELQRFSVRQR